MKKEQTGELKQHIVPLPQLFMCFYACLAFLPHLFMYELSATAYCLALVFLLTVFVISKPIVKKGLPLLYLFAWIAALAVLLINYLFRYRSRVVLIDVGVLICGFVLIACFSKAFNHYLAALVVIKGMAIFFGIGVILQGLIPSAYRVIIKLFPSNLQGALRRNLPTGRIEGFTTNPGFAAGYVIAGVFAICALSKRDKRSMNRDLIVILLLMASLLMVGKRGPFLFMIMSLAIIRILPERGTRRVKKLWIGLMVFSSIIVLFYLLQDVLVNIPLLRRYVATIQGFLGGDDVSSGRSRLTSWAIELFRQNPIVGIGWGRYRTTTLGNATRVKYLDTHNVYLQLLSETGIIGFAAFALVFALSWNMTRKGYCECIRSEDEMLIKWLPSLTFSFAFQTFFLLYCLSGNPLYDQFYQMLYALSCSVAVAYNYVSGKRLGRGNVQP